MIVHHFYELSQTNILEVIETLTLFARTLMNQMPLLWSRNTETWCYSYC